MDYDRVLIGSLLLVTSSLEIFTAYLEYTVVKTPKPLSVYLTHRIRDKVNMLVLTSFANRRGPGRVSCTCFY